MMFVLLGGAVRWGHMEGQQVGAGVELPLLGEGVAGVGAPHSRVAERLLG